MSLIKVRELSRNLSKEDRHTPHLQAGVKRLDDRWSKAQAAFEDRQKQLTAALESGPPKQFLSTMDAVLLKIKNMESQLGSEFLISDTASLEEQLQKYKVCVEGGTLEDFIPLNFKGFPEWYNLKLFQERALVGDDQREALPSHAQQARCDDCFVESAKVSLIF